MADAVALLRAELGRDAVILQTRKVREKGLWGLLGRRRVEVVAALEDAPRRTPPPRPFPRPAPGHRAMGTPAVAAAGGGAPPGAFLPCPGGVA